MASASKEAWRMDCLAFSRSREESEREMLRAGVVGCAQGAGPLVFFHEGGPLAHHVVVAAFLVAEGLLHLLGVFAGLFEAALYLRQARLGLLLLLDHLDGGLPLAPAGELARLALLDGQDLLLGGGIVGEHLLVGHRARRRYLQLFEVLELVLDGVFEQYLGVALLDPGEKAPEETADRPKKSSHLRRPPPAVVRPAKSVVDYTIGTNGPRRGFSGRPGRDRPALPCRP
jgi:hypothetical protein